jgi:hypothetical protein
MPRPQVPRQTDDGVGVVGLGDVVEAAVAQAVVGMAAGEDMGGVMAYCEMRDFVVWRDRMFDVRWT